ncbi:MAG: ribosome-associated translation inhibitor RaiA [Candidatus Neomarinimicrobiota bacterium]
MVIEFTARHFKAPDQLKEYAEEEMNRLHHYYDRITQGQIILAHENNSFWAEINLSVPHEKLNVRESSDNITKSIDQAVSTMITRIKKYKDKQKHF